MPYDTSFWPETNLPGLNIDLSYFAPTDEGSSQLSSVWTKSPINSLSGASQFSSLQLELPSDDMGEGTIMGLDTIGSGRKDLLRRVAGLGLEEGGLLQPDFEFDEDGNLVELEGRARTPHLSQKFPDGVRESEGLFERRDDVDGQLWGDRVSVGHGCEYRGRTG
jgi:meiotic recombination protein REC8